MKRLSPASLQYAVIRINPEAMVEHFGDSGATTRARALHAQKYLVYLDLELDLPFPTSEWFRFRSSPIASSLRPEDAERGITSDMVVPIHPNPDRPQGRAPIVTEPPFPFDNCYHWVNNTMTVRVRRKPELYDDTGAVKVSSAEHVRLGMALWEDCNRVYSASEAVHEDAGPVAQLSRSRRPSQSSEVSSSIVDSSDDELPQTPATGSLPLAHSRNCSVKDIMAMDVFNLAHQDSEETMPLVDLWFDLAAHFPDGKIPNPLDLEQEQDTVSRYVRHPVWRFVCSYTTPVSFARHAAGTQECPSRSVTLGSWIPTLKATLRTTPRRRCQARAKATAVSLTMTKTSSTRPRPLPTPVTPNQNPEPKYAQGQAACSPARSGSKRRPPRSRLSRTCRSHGLSPITAV
ncbi:hypothetical protein BD413DRAFT_307579 [Trametes elegans]|nr:hypothetical protein BD413DRAFT_307579 [Trametes elegans]